MRVALPAPSLSCAPRVLPSWRVLSYARQTPQHHPRARGALRQVAGGQQQGEDEHAATSRPPPPVLPVKEELSGSAELQDAGAEEQAEEGGGDAVAAAGELQDGEEIAPHAQDEPASSLGASQVPPTQEYEELLSAPASAWSNDFEPSPGMWINCILKVASAHPTMLHREGLGRRRHNFPSTRHHKALASPPLDGLCSSLHHKGLHSSPHREVQNNCRGSRQSINCHCPVTVGSQSSTSGH